MKDINENKKFQSQLHKIKNYLKKKDIKNYNDLLNDLNNFYKNKNKNIFIKLKTNDEFKLNNSANINKIAKSKNLIKTAEKDLDLGSTLDDLKKCKNFYSNNTNNTNNTNNDETNSQILELIYYNIIVVNKINNINSINLSHTKIENRNIKKIKEELNIFFDDEHNKLQNTIDIFNESVTAMKYSKESKLYLLYFNYNILKEKKKKINICIKSLKKKNKLNKDLFKYLKNINK